MLESSWLVIGTSRTPSVVTMQELVTVTVMMKEAAGDGDTVETVTLMVKLVPVSGGSRGKVGVHEQEEEEEAQRILTHDALKTVFCGRELGGGTAALGG
jgi:hypothetical protein